MRLLRTLICFSSALLLLAGCAATRVSGPAKTIGAEVSKFHADLSSFQDDMKTLQDDEQTRMVGTAARRDLAISATKQLQVEWAIIHAKSEAEMFTVLQTQGHDEMARLTAQATPAPKTQAVALPLDKLAAVAATLDQLSKPSGVQANLEFLINYGIEVNKQLQSIEDQAKKKAQAGTAAATSTPPK
jgi:hypothetical protein